MDNFIEDSVDYLYFNGGFDLATGDQVFQFRVRPDSEIEVVSICNHIKTTYKGEPDVYQFFAFLIFCDMYASHQRTVLSMCNDKNVSRNNLKALNRVYNIYQTMLLMDGADLALALSDEDPGALDRVMLESSYSQIGEKQSKLKFDTIKSRVESYAWYFARRYEYFDNLYQEMLTSDEDEPIHEYAMVKWEELRNNVDAIHTKFFTKEETLKILFERTCKLEDDLRVSFDGGELEKHRILNIIIDLYDKQVDVMDMVYFIKCAVSACCMDGRNIVTLDDVLESIEVSYLPGDIKNDMVTRLSSKPKHQGKGNIITFPGV